MRIRIALAVAPLALAAAIGLAAGPPATAGTQPVTHSAPAAAHVKSTSGATVYLIEVAGNHNWCLADPSSGGWGTGLVLWGCQAQLWFGWTAAPIRYGTYANEGYFLLVSQSASNRCASNPGTAGGRITIQSCNWNDPHQVWGEFDNNATSAWDESLSGSYPTLANDHGTLSDGNPIVGWLSYNPPIPADELWTGIQGA